MEEIILHDILEREGVKFKDEHEKAQFLKELQEAVEKGYFHFIVKNGVRVGFFCFREVKKNGKTHIYIDNLLVFKKFRNRNSLLNLRGYIRQRCKNVSFYFYHLQKYDKFRYHV